jgi:hypothetical protein
LRRRGSASSWPSSGGCRGCATPSDEEILSVCHAVILGAGPISLLGAMLLRLYDVPTVVYSTAEPPAPEVDVTRAIGAEYVSSEREEFGAVAGRLGSVELVYEGTGAAELMFGVLPELGPNAVFVATGVPGPGGNRRSRRTASCTSSCSRTRCCAARSTHRRRLRPGHRPPRPDAGAVAGRDARPHHAPPRHGRVLRERVQLGRPQAHRAAGPGLSGRVGPGREAPRHMPIPPSLLWPASARIATCRRVGCGSSRFMAENGVQARPLPL